MSGERAEFGRCWNRGENGAEHRASSFGSDVGGKSGQLACSGEGRDLNEEICFVNLRWGSRGGGAGRQGKSGVSSCTRGASWRGPDVQS